MPANLAIRMRALDGMTGIVMPARPARRLLRTAGYIAVTALGLASGAVLGVIAALMLGLIALC